jgi:hypothetical protein
MSETLQVKKFSKDILARAMAQEDITVQHSASAQTAYFDTKNRVLCLPVWKDMDNSMYDMLVGHEVSHALHTPMEGWQEFVGKGSGSGMRHMFLNVVEDARIERKIKDKFPGLRRDFSKAYSTLNERDIFEIAGKDLSAMSLIDRLNIQFKTGLHCGVSVPFTSTEQAYVTRMAETKTFEDVMELAGDLYDLHEEEKEEEEKEQGQDQQPQSGEGDGSGGGDVPDDSQDDSQDESGEGSSAGAGDEDGDEESSGSSTGDGDEDGDESNEDSGASAEDDTDDGESADSTDGDGQSGDGDSEMEYDDYENDIDAAGSTQRSFEQGMSDLVDNETGEYHYSALPTPILENIVIDFAQVEQIWNTKRAAVEAKYGDEAKKALDTSEEITSLHEYRQKIKGTVNIMVQQFQMKQAAEADKRTEIAKTGVLDTVNMINYRWSEDIFVKNEVHADGKNHGMVMYVDWSGSMSGILQDTVEQLLVLVEFCKKVNIPFEVYAFSSNQYAPDCPHDDRWSEEARKWHEAYAENNPQWNMVEGDTEPHAFQLYNFLSSRMNKRQYQTGMQNLWILTQGSNHYGSYHIPRCFSLGSTPLNEAVLCAMTMVPEFQAMHGIEIVNTVILSDGEGHGMCRHRSYKGRSFITDKKSKKNYEIDYNKREGETMALLEMLKDRTQCNTIGIRLHASANIRHMRYSFPEGKFEKACKEYKTNNFTTLESSYDEYFLVRGDLKVETDALENVNENSSYTVLKNAFIKGGNNKKSSRVIATKMVDIFAA